MKRKWCKHTKPNPKDDKDKNGKRYTSCYWCFVAGVEARNKLLGVPTKRTRQ